MTGQYSLLSASVSVAWISFLLFCGFHTDLSIYCNRVVLTGFFATLKYHLIVRHICICVASFSSSSSFSAVCRVCMYFVQYVCIEHALVLPVGVYMMIDLAVFYHMRETAAAACRGHDRVSLLWVLYEVLTITVTNARIGGPRILPERPTELLFLISCLHSSLGFSY